VDSKRFQIPLKFFLLHSFHHLTRAKTAYIVFSPTQELEELEVEDKEGVESEIWWKIP
jgi:uncharacterized protein YuzE